MSHLSSITTVITNEEAVSRSCRELGLEAPAHGTYKLFRAEVKGLGVRLPDWQFPIVINTDTGKVSFDNYNGSWGKQVELDKFTQRYSLEVGKMDAEAKSLQYEEIPLENGERLLRVYLGGEDAEMAGAGSTAPSFD